MITTKTERAITSIIAAFVYLYLYYNATLFAIYKFSIPLSSAGFTFILAPLGLFPLVLMAFTPNITRIKYYVTLILSALGPFIVLFSFLATIMALYFCLKVKRIKSFLDADIPEQYFRSAADEIQTKNTIGGLYEKSQALAGGDQNKANVFYAMARARQLYDLEHANTVNEKIKSEIFDLTDYWGMVGKSIFWSAMALLWSTWIFKTASITGDVIQWITAWDNFVFERMGEFFGPAVGNSIVARILSHMQILITLAVPFILTFGCLKIRNSKMTKMLSKGASYVDESPSMIIPPLLVKNDASRALRKAQESVTAYVTPNDSSPASPPDTNDACNKETLYEIGRFDAMFAKRVLKRLEAEKIPIVTEIENSALSDPFRDTKTFWNSELKTLWQTGANSPRLVIFVPESFSERAEKIMTELFPDSEGRESE